MTTSDDGSGHTNRKRQRGLPRVTRGILPPPSLARRVSMFDDTRCPNNTPPLQLHLVVFGDKCRPAGDTDTPRCRRRCRGHSYTAGCLRNLKWVVRAPQRTHLLLPRKVKLSNCAVRRSDVSLGPASERKLFSKIRLGAELRAPGRRAAVKIGNLAALAGVRTRTRVAPRR